MIYRRTERRTTIANTKCRMTRQYRRPSRLENMSVPSMDKGPVSYITALSNLGRWASVVPLCTAGWVLPARADEMSTSAKKTPWRLSYSDGSRCTAAERTHLYDTLAAVP
eukprot:Lankesteria_metandrocarpae@DN7316_c0_g1_i1.p1